jgi:hypothetical protein
VNTFDINVPRRRRELGVGRSWRTMKRTLLLLAAAIALSAAPTRAQGTETLALPTGAAQTVFDYYFKIQTALAKDSMENVAVNAGIIAEIVRKDTTGAFPSPLASQAEALAKAKDLAAARQVFKAVSGYLIQSFRAGKAPVGTHEVIAQWPSSIGFKTTRPCGIPFLASPC